MDELLRRIVGILGEDSVSVHIYDGNVWFELFESAIVVNVDFENNQALVETVDCELDTYRLAQLYDIVNLIDQNIEVIKNIL